MKNLSYGGEQEKEYAVFWDRRERKWKYEWI